MGSYGCLSSSSSVSLSRRTGAFRANSSAGDGNVGASLRSDGSLCSGETPRAGSCGGSPREGLLASSRLMSYLKRFQSRLKRADESKRNKKDTEVFCVHQAALPSLSPTQGRSLVARGELCVLHGAPTRNSLTLQYRRKGGSFSPQERSKEVVVHPCPFPHAMCPAKYQLQVTPKTYLSRWVVPLPFFMRRKHRTGTGCIRD